MIITVAFDVKNYVEVMEGWPIKTGDMTFFLERDGNVLKRVCLAFSGVTMEHAPTIKPGGDGRDIPNFSINGGEYAALATKSIMNWQAVISGIQIVDLDLDNYELRFGAENISEEPLIPIKSFKQNSSRNLNASCDFEQIGRAFCVGRISDDRIESTSHFREGRIAFEAGRYVDAYNNMFLFLETRYCDGKTGNDKQTDILLKQKDLCDVIEKTVAEFTKESGPNRAEKFDLIKPSDEIREKIKTLVLLRGKLRHHFLKSPHRWDPNRQDEYRSAARFLSAVVGDVVIKESIDDIYMPEVLEEFRSIAVATGFETKIRLATRRLDGEVPPLTLNMSYPTTVVSSKLCLAVLRNAIKECEADGQILDTVRLEGTHTQIGLELLSVELGVWAFTPNRSVQTKAPIGAIRCSFEHNQAGIIVKHEFSIPFQGNRLVIPQVWKLLLFCFDRIEKIDPTTRVMQLKLFISERTPPIATYRVGSQVTN